jgi:uncharacterized protein (TIGR00369 family)
MEPINKLKEIPNSGTHQCFACSPANRSGLKMRLYTDNRYVYSWPSVPAHMGGWNRIVHGGIVCTILDEIMGWAGLFFLKQVTLTRSMTVEFISAVKVQEKLKARAHVVEFDGRRTAKAEAEIFNEKGVRCATAFGSFAVLSPQVARRLGIMTDEDIKTFFEPLLKM